MNFSKAYADLPTSGVDRLNPMPGFVIVEKVLPGMTEGGLHIPQSAKGDDIPRARVLRVGKGEPLLEGGNREPEVMVGDIILIRQAHELPFDGNKNLYLVPMHDIVVTVSPDRNN